MSYVRYLCKYSTIDSSRTPHSIHYFSDLLTYFASKDLPFLMECCRRTEADKKGGHLAVRTSDGQLILRESAQCAKEDEPAFQNVDKHQFFNTNNLWVRLDFLKKLMDSKGGFVPLPTLLNGKTVDPQQVWAAVESPSNSLESSAF